MWAWQVCSHRGSSGTAGVQTPPKAGVEDGQDDPRNPTPRAITGFKAAALCLIRFVLTFQAATVLASLVIMTQPVQGVQEAPAQHHPHPSSLWPQGQHTPGVWKLMRLISTGSLG